MAGHLPALARRCESEVVDTAEEALAYDGLDHNEVNRMFVADLLDHFPGRGPILDLGTGTARIPIQLCLQDPGARVVGIDLARSMLALARRNIAAADLGNRIAVERADAKRLPFGGAVFPAVISNSLVHHMASPEVLLREAWRALAPGGLLFIRDLIRPADERALENLLESYAPHATQRQRRMFEDSMRAALTVGEAQLLAAEIGSMRDSVRATSDRHWTLAVRKP